MNEPGLKKVPYRCALQIQAVYDSLKSAERKAVDFILGSPSEISDLAIGNFAIRAGCSEATIVRLAKRLGYEGYPELKADFADDTTRDGYLEYESIKKSDEPFMVLRKVFDRTVASIKDTANAVSAAEFQRAVDAVVSAGDLMFCGVGDAGIVATEACQRFVRAGHRAVAHLDFDLQLIAASQLSSGDVLVAISHSGKSRSVLEVVKVARGQGATVVAISNYPAAPLAKRADVLLQTAAFSRHLTGEVVSKRVSELCIVESLYVCYLLRKGRAATAQLEQSNRIVQINKL